MSFYKKETEKIELVARPGMWLYSWTHCHCIQRSQSAPERGRGRPWKSLLLQP